MGPRVPDEYQDGEDEDEWVLRNSMSEEDYEELCRQRDGDPYQDFPNEDDHEAQDNSSSVASV